MTVAIVKLTNEANRVVNIVKAKYDLKDKSQALNKLIEEYEEEILEPELKPEFVEKIRQIEKSGKFTRIHDIEDIWK